MEQRWYWRRKGGQSHGPVSTALLDDLIRFKNIGDNDEVRLDTNDTWINASEIRTLFAQTEDPEDCDLARVVRRAADTKAASPSQDAVESAHHSFFQRVLESCLSWVGNVSSLTSDLLSTVTDKLFALVALLRLKWVLVSFAVLLLGIFVKDAVFRQSLNQASMAEMSEIWDQMDLLLGRKTSESDWSEFRTQAMEELRPILQQLEETARNSPRDPSRYWTSSGFNEAMIRSDLIQAGATLREMLQAQGGDERARNHFHQKLEDVRVQMATGSRSNLADTKSNAKASDTLGGATLAMILVDILIVGGVLFWWLKGRR